MIKTKCFAQKFKVFATKSCNYYSEVENLLANVRKGYTFSGLDSIVFERCSVCKNVIAEMDGEISQNNKNWFQVWLTEHDSNDLLDADAAYEDFTFSHWTGNSSNFSDKYCGKWCCLDFKE